MLWCWVVRESELVPKNSEGMDRRVKRGLTHLCRLAIRLRSLARRNGHTILVKLRQRSRLQKERTFCHWFRIPRSGESKALLSLHTHWQPVRSTSLPTLHVRCTHNQPLPSVVIQLKKPFLTRGWTCLETILTRLAWFVHRRPAEELASVLLSRLFISLCTVLVQGVAIGSSIGGYEEMGETAKELADPEVRAGGDAHGQHLAASP
mgnify:CR=1 FL=1